MMKNARRFLALLALALIFLSLASGVVRAQDPTPSDDDVNAVARQLYCPVCETTPLDVCPTEACRQWRDLIRQMLAEGKTPQEIEQYFVENYGARVLSEPPRTGLNWLVYVVPPVAFLLGVFMLFRAFRLWRQQTPAGPAPAATADTSADPYVNRLEEELKKRK
jgi:cytochrome c-type biogenesis protein CcmH